MEEAVLWRWTVQSKTQRMLCIETIEEEVSSSARTKADQATLRPSDPILSRPSHRSPSSLPPPNPSPTTQVSGSQLSVLLLPYCLLLTRLDSQGNHPRLVLGGRPTVPAFLQPTAPSLARTSRAHFHHPPGSGWNHLLEACVLSSQGCCGPCVLGGRGGGGAGRFRGRGVVRLRLLRGGPCSCGAAPCAVPTCRPAAETQLQVSRKRHAFVSASRDCTLWVTAPA